MRPAVRGTKVNWEIAMGQALLSTLSHLILAVTSAQGAIITLQRQTFSANCPN